MRGGRPEARLGQGVVNSAPFYSSDVQRLFPLEAQGIMQAAISPDWLLIATGSYDRTVRLWGAGNGKLLKTLYGRSGIITGLTFSPSGEWLASSWMDGIESCGDWTKLI